ncbi:MAG: hypothetical protein IKX86_05915 [Clostridia bacterium]|nr:hypothetical protein [Clostridia bacterium]
MKKILIPIITILALLLLVSSCMSEKIVEQHKQGNDASPAAGGFEFSTDKEKNTQLNNRYEKLRATATFKLTEDAWSKAEQIFSEGKDVTVRLDSEYFNLLRTFANENTNFSGADNSITIRCPASGVNGKMILFVSTLLDENAESCFYDETLAEFVANPATNFYMNVPIEICADAPLETLGLPDYASLRLLGKLYDAAEFPEFRSEYETLDKYRADKKWADDLCRNGYGSAVEQAFNREKSYSYTGIIAEIVPGEHFISIRNGLAFGVSIDLSSENPFETAPQLSLT